jgi:hypothetical protein
MKRRDREITEPGNPEMKYLDGGAVDRGDRPIGCTALAMNFECRKINPRHRPTEEMQ